MTDQGSRLEDYGVAGLVGAHAPLVVAARAQRGVEQTHVLEDVLRREDVCGRAEMQVLGEVLLREAFGQLTALDVGEAVWVPAEDLDAAGDESAARGFARKRTIPARSQPGSGWQSASVKAR